MKWEYGYKLAFAVIAFIIILLINWYFRLPDDNNFEELTERMVYHAVDYDIDFTPFSKEN